MKSKAAQCGSVPLLLHFSRLQQSRKTGKIYHEKPEYHKSIQPISAETEQATVRIWKRRVSNLFSPDCRVGNKTCLHIQYVITCVIKAKVSSYSNVKSSDVLLLQWQWWEATEGQPSLAEQGDQSSRQRRQPGGLRRRGRSVQRGRLVYRRVRRAEGKEGVLWDQSRRSEPSVRPRLPSTIPSDAVFIKPRWEE